VSGVARCFDWSGFKASVDKRGGDGVALSGFKKTTITRNGTTVQGIVPEITTFILSMIPTRIDPEQLSAALERKLTDLETAKERGWADFTKGSEVGKSSWEYRIVFGFPNPDLADYLHTLVTTIRLEGNMVEESEWMLPNSSPKNLTVAIHAMALLVQKGFMSPST
jgi:hypothetical protein